MILSLPGRFVKRGPLRYFIRQPTLVVGANLAILDATKLHELLHDM
jgi:hypothetical protein